MRQVARIVLLVSVCVAMLQTISWAEKGDTKKPVRALPPTEWDSEVRSAFFPNALETLKGERPDFENLKAAPKAGGSGGGSNSAPSGTVFAWSKLISAESVEDEIKKQKILIDKAVTIPGKFKGGLYQDARRHFSVLAMLFAISDQFDGDVRWKKDAGGLRDLFAQAGFSCKVGSDASYNQAKLRKQDLGDLIQGQSVQVTPAQDIGGGWNTKVTNRPPLMQRMEIALQNRIQPWVSNEDAFNKNLDEISHEAQLLAAMAELIQREDYEYWDDEDYLNFAKMLKEASVQMTEGVRDKNYEKVRAASGEAAKACSECHDSYRG